MTGSDASGPPGEGGPTETVRAAVVPRLGGRLGRYELLEVVGHGAMATVFRARDSQLGREVAVKVMSLAVAARAESAERFRREAQAVAAVKHPGIVEIFDFVAATDTEPAYIVSELIQGPTLRQFLDSHRGRLLPESAALIAIPIAEALAVAHARGIVHRDVKPDNVMLDRGGGKCRVVLTDFGVAHITGLETMTATGALVGSPAFMSPEQARGHGVGPASDVWALGVLLYEMATGHLPFPGKDALLVVAAIARGLYKKPSLVSPYVGGGLDAISGRCLQLAPGERYPQLQALANDLRAFFRAGGLEPDGGALPALITDPERFEAGLRPKVADAAVAQARRHSRRGELARALGELARATAYVPRHAEAERLVASISWRRRWLKVTGVAAAVAAVAGAGLWLGPRVREMALQMMRSGQVPVATTAMPVGQAPRADETAAEPAVKGAAPPVEAMAAALAAGNTHASTAPLADRRKQRDRARSVRVARQEAPPLEEAKVPESAAAEAQEQPAPETPAPVAAPPPLEPRRVAVEIYASRGICNPSLDELKPSVSPTRYPAVAEGEHTVYCNWPGGRRLKVGRFHISPRAQGGPFQIVIRQDEQTKQPIAASRTTGVRQPDPGAEERAPSGSEQPR